MNLIYLDEVHSTNQYLHELLQREKCEEGTCVQTRFQKAGRGQQGNSWESEAGKNLTFSLVLFPDFLSAVDQFILSQMVSLGIKEVLDNYMEGVSIKWPNDIYWHEKKIAGILIENSLMGSHIEHTVIGIGLNVNQELFVSSAPNPVSMKQITGREFNLEALLNELLQSIFSQYLKLIQDEDGDIRFRYLNSLYRRDGFHKYADANGEFMARIEKVSQTGRLCLITDSGEQREYYFKEVSFV
ncbi:biotin--[acetyl-CoA-carboxylase] ligase [Parabacteroides sp. FAFU027]|uniref:biotin--[acetyl-CoA-carboxylase] ligase n=1 Tax=Parabacteroides sp. FAFU027 TaxID=2922715 RepID=UPI001FAF89D8|nr:biotin--[acetyl-CoA-carboxylase] ligase [Parabacteroides sp. FAFU027]